MVWRDDFCCFVCVVVYHTAKQQRSARYKALMTHDHDHETDNDYVERNRLRRTPLSWPEMKSIISSPNVEDLSKLARSEEQSRSYQRWRANIKDEWETIYDYLLCTKFGYDWIWTDDAQVGMDSGCHTNNTKSTRLKRSLKPSPPQRQQHLQHDDDACTSSQLKLCKNDFPYYFEPGIQHWVLWKLGGRVTQNEITSAKISIWKIFESSLEMIAVGKILVSDPDLFLHWENPPELQSLPGINHIHIIFHGRV